MRFGAIGLCLALLAGCAGSPPSGPAAPPLVITFTDPAWNGQAVPQIGRCQNCGGGGMSPALLVRGLPPGTEAVVVEFNDLTYTLLSRGGGHGAIRVAAAGQTQVQVPSFRENSEVLPDGVTMVHRHRAVGYGKGAYLGPCGCGSNNLYEAVVKAVRRGDSGEDEVIVRTAIELGRF